MIKKSLFIVLLALSAFAQIVVEKVRQEPIGRIYHASAEVIELSSVRQEVVLPVDLVIERYLVKEGQKVAKDQRIAIARSKTLTSWSNRYIAKKKELASLQRRYKQAAKLYKERLITLGQFEAIRTKLAKVKSTLSELREKLAMIGIQPSMRPIQEFAIRSKAEGRIDTILVPPHTSIAANRPIATIVRTQGLSLLVYLPLDIALSLKRPKALFRLARSTYPATFVQLMPKVDKETMQARALFVLPKDAKLLVGAYGDCAVQLKPTSKKILVRRSALTMLENGWAIFVKEKEGYEPRAVDVEDFWGEWAIVRGIEPGIEYVREGVYILKSRLLKEMIGEEE